MAILAEKYAVDYTWYVDVILNLIRISGDYVSEEVGVSDPSSSPAEYRTVTVSVICYLDPSLISDIDPSVLYDLDTGVIYDIDPCVTYDLDTV